jgi:guanosine-diphosphatase
MKMPAAAYFINEPSYMVSTTRNPQWDPFEKPARHSRSPLSLTSRMQLLMNTRFSRVVIGAIVLFILGLTLIGGPTYPHTITPTESSSKGALPSLTCTKSFDGIRPVTQYVVMIDAGSSGSRVHVYSFNNCQETPRLLKEEFKMIEPGLSSYDDPELAAASLDELLDLAVASVPIDSQSCTPLAVKATAGLRILGTEKADRILSAVRHRLETKYPFAVAPGDGISIMDGSDEGVYAWITANYLLGNIGTSEKTPTAAVFDLGGGSTQIVFEPTFNVPGKEMAPGDHKYDLEFGNRKFSLYQHSHLMYGLNEARKRINSQIVANYLKSGTSIAKAAENGIPTQLVNPCMPPGSLIKGRKVAVAKDSGTIEYIVDLVGPKEHSETQCRRLAETILNKDENCAVEPCSFNGVHQPRIIDTVLKESDIYIFSFFYDRTFPLGMPSSFSMDELKDLAGKVCRGKDSYDSFAALDGATEALDKNPEWCLDLNFIVALLHTGYEIPGHREVKIAKKIKNNELGWCLGASLPLLDQGSAGWKCTIKADQTKR